LPARTGSLARHRRHVVAGMFVGRLRSREACRTNDDQSACEARTDAHDVHRPSLPSRAGPAGGQDAVEGGPTEIGRVRLDAKLCIESEWIWWTRLDADRRRIPCIKGGRQNGERRGHESWCGERLQRLIDGARAVIGMPAPVRRRRDRKPIRRRFLVMTGVMFANRSGSTFARGADRLAGRRDDRCPSHHEYERHSKETRHQSEFEYMRPG